MCYNISVNKINLYSYLTIKKIMGSDLTAKGNKHNEN